jgi:HAD superfamily hydrolase (TIGR01509 family)
MPAAKALRAVFFDMDDTLLEPRHPHPLPLFKSKHGLPLNQLVIEGVRNRAPQEQQAILEEFHALERELSATSNLRAGILELLSELRCHNLHLALLTNNHRDSVEIVLKRHGLSFPLVLTREDAQPKPAPDLILRALEHFGLKPHEAIYVGDSLADLRAAQAAGVRAVFLATPDNTGLEPRHEHPSGLLTMLNLSPT